MTGHTRRVISLVLAVVVGCGTAANASGLLRENPAAATTGRHAGVTPGVPPGGPSVLYTPPPVLPQLHNHDRRFRAPFEMVSGTERYVDGEYLYTGFLYDDDGSAYPTDWTRYANNSANLVEFRMAGYRGGILYRFTFNTLLQKNSTIATVAFNADRKRETGSSALPRDPGVPFPGTDHVLTTWGTGAEWSRWSGTRWTSVPLKVITDLAANQITVAVPDAVARPTGTWSATQATGLYDTKTGGWLPIASNSANTSNVVDLGFRFNEMQAASPSTNQTAALQAGAPTRFAHALNFAWLRQHHNWDNVPTHGMIYRMFASRLKSATADNGDAPSGNSIVDSLGTSATTGKPVQRSEGKDHTSILAGYLSPLQPYAIYVPASYRPGHPTKLTFALHGFTSAYHWINAGAHTPKLLGDDRSSIVLSPGARGGNGFYVGDMEHDVFEAWNDAARHYNLDAARTSLFGVSMGGYGAYRLATLYPHLFARAVPLIPAGSRGMYFPGFTDGNTSVNHWLPSLRNIPVFHIADAASELTFYPGQAQNAVGPNVNGMHSLESLKYRYVFRSVAVDHFLMGDNFPELTGWLSDHRIEPRAFHVTYVRMPSSDTRRDGLVHNQAYWLSRIEVRDNNSPYAKGLIDGVSLGFGLGEPTTGMAPTAIPGVDAEGRPFLQLERDWSGPSRVQAQNRIVLKATNIGSVAIDVKAARVTCDVKLDIHSDGPLKVTLLGCPR